MANQYALTYVYGDSEILAMVPVAFPYAMERVLRETKPDISYNPWNRLHMMYFADGILCTMPVLSGGAHSLATWRYIFSGNPGVAPLEALRKLPIKPMPDMSIHDEDIVMQTVLRNVTAATEAQMREIDVKALADTPENVVIPHVKGWKRVGMTSRLGVWLEENDGKWRAITYLGTGGVPDDTDRYAGYLKTRNLRGR